MIFPYIAEEDTSKAAVQFFLGSAIGAIPSVMARTIPQIAFQAGDLYIPIIGAVLLYIPSIAAGYYLAFNEDMGAFGIDLGKSIVTRISYAIIHASFLRKHYYPLHLFEITTSNITTWIGVINKKSLVEATPAEQYITILSLGMQGFAQVQEC